MKNLKTKLTRFDKDIKKRVNKLKITTAQFILWELTQVTPVDTSKALSNWVANLQKPNSRVIQAHSVGSKGSTQSISSHTTFMIGQSVIGRAKVGEIIYITNNVDYIELLNLGLSQQAERNFIQNAVDVAINKANRVKL